MKKLLSAVLVGLFLCSGIAYAGDPIFVQENSTRSWKIGVGLGGSYPTSNWSIYDNTAGSFRMTIDTSGIFYFPGPYCIFSIGCDGIKG